MGASAKTMFWFGFRHTREIRGEPKGEDVVDDVLRGLAAKYEWIIPDDVEADEDGNLFGLDEFWISLENYALVVAEEGSPPKGRTDVGLMDIDGMGSGRCVGWGVYLCSVYWWDNPISLDEMAAKVRGKLAEHEEIFRRFLRETLTPELWASVEPHLNVWSIPNWD